MHDFSDFSDEGTTTVEYAFATIAAAGFGIVLYAIANSDKVQDWLTDLIEKAMTMT